MERAISPSAPPSKRSAHLDGLLDEYAPPEEAKTPLSLTSGEGLKQNLSPSPSARLSPEHDYALRGESLALGDSLAFNEGLNRQMVNLWASVPEMKGYAKLHHAITDQLYRMLDPIEQAIYTQLYRLSHGFDKPTCIISLPKLAERANVGMTATHAAIKRLVKKGVVEKKAWIVGKGKEQGVEFSLPLPAWLSPDASHARNASLSPREPIIEHRIKDTHNTAEIVRVCSRFSLADCRRYADHLRSTGQGITNPGGYATKIHRSGEADSLIEAYLAPPKQVSTVDVSRCPDCQGTGFWEPAGKGKGVAKCKHEQIGGQVA